MLTFPCLQERLVNRPTGRRPRSHRAQVKTIPKQCKTFLWMWKSTTKAGLIRKDGGLLTCLCPESNFLTNHQCLLANTHGPVSFTLSITLSEDSFPCDLFLVHCSLEVKLLNQPEGLEINFVILIQILFSIFSYYLTNKRNKLCWMINLLLLLTD